LGYTAKGGKKKGKKRKRKKQRKRLSRRWLSLSLSPGRGLLARSSRTGTAPHIVTLLPLWQ
jgi:hypothetical protein